MICKRATYFKDSEMIEYYQKTCGLKSKSRKTENYVKKLRQIHYAEKTFLMVYVATYDCYENIKIKL